MSINVIDVLLFMRACHIFISSSVDKPHIDAGVEQKKMRWRQLPTLESSNNLVK